jgi:integrase
MGNLRTLYSEYFAFMGDKERKNPFDGLSFSEKKKRKRPPFPVQWMKDEILVPGKLATMNDQARAILLILVETGARMGEIANLNSATIDIASNVPHIKIEPRHDPDDPREIKTQSSIRTIPLIGMALEALRRHPNGFPRYKDKETVLSNTLNKFFRDNNLFPTDKHTIYSFRHSFEDRMKEAGLDHELRRMLMGHVIDRPDYGIGGAMEWRLRELMKIALKFDKAIV